MKCSYFSRCFPKTIYSFCLWFHSTKTTKNFQQKQHKVRVLFNALFIHFNCKILKIEECAFRFACMFNYMTFVVQSRAQCSFHFYCLLCSHKHSRTFRIWLVCVPVFMYDVWFSCMHSYDPFRNPKKKHFVDGRIGMWMCCMVYKTRKSAMNSYSTIVENMCSMRSYQALRHC